MGEMAEAANDQSDSGMGCYNCYHRDACDIAKENGFCMLWGQDVQPKTYLKAFLS